MPRFWGFHHIICHTNELRFLPGQTRVYQDVPIDERMRVGDFVFLFWGDDDLLGWGSIYSLGGQKENLKRDVTVFHSLVREQLAKVRGEIKPNPLFQNYDRLKEDGVLSLFNDDQVNFLRGLCQHRGGSCPPNPNDLKEVEAKSHPKRPPITEFIKGRKLRIDETRFDEFKSVTSSNVVGRIVDEAEQYVVGFLNIEDRREADVCRIFWGIQDKTGIIEGVKASRGQRDEIRKNIDLKLSRIIPSIPPSSHEVKVFEVTDESGNVIYDLVVVVVEIGHGAINEFYCTQNNSFYIKLDASCPKLEGQRLVEEIRRRLKKGLQIAPETIDKSILPS